jgi:glycosyltransferase involved in cell wall biosynthesis
VETLFWLWRLRQLHIPILYAIQIARPARHGSAIQRRLKKLMQRVFYNCFDGVITNSDTISVYLRSLGVRTPIAVIPNGVDLNRFHPSNDANVRSQTRVDLGVTGSGPLILSVGAICPRKGTHLLLEAWTKILDRHPDAELVFVGPRHDRNNQTLSRFDLLLKELIARSGHPERVHFAGIRNDMNEVYGAADIVVLPSSREGMPNAVLEAMACERPVLLTPFEGQSDAMGRPGIEFEQAPRTPKGVAKSLDKMLNDRARCDELVRNGKAWVTQHLDVESNLDRYVEFYRQAAAGSLAATQLRDIDLEYSAPSEQSARARPS